MVFSFTYAFVTFLLKNDTRMDVFYNFSPLCGQLFLFLEFMYAFILPTFIKAFTFLFFVCNYYFFTEERYVNGWFYNFSPLCGQLFLFLEFMYTFILPIFIKAFTFLFYACFCHFFTEKRYTSGYLLQFWSFSWSYLPFFGFNVYFYTAYLYKSIHISLLRMLLSLFH